MHHSDVAARRFRPLTTLVLVAGLLAAGLSMASIGGAPPAGAVGPDDRSIVYPVLGGASLVDTFGACRGSGCSRSHQGQDLFGDKMTPLVAAVDGRVYQVSRSSRGLSGNYIGIEDAAGWRYLYLHLNNDSPGTDDGVNPPEWSVAPGLAVGSRVRAGQLVGYLGDSGNAETTPPHLHFEIRTPANHPINAMGSLVAARHAGLPAGWAEAHNPRGAFDGVQLHPGGLRVTGWAADPDSSGAIGVLVYADGWQVGRAQAQATRQDVAAVTGLTATSGYDLTTVVGAGRRRVCVYAVNDGAGGGTRLGCRVVTIPADPFGNFESAVAVPGGLRLTGWAADPNSAAPLQVHAYVDAASRGVVADRDRPDVARALPGWGAARGFHVDVGAGAGRRRVCTYAINAAGTAGRNVALGGCRIITVPGDPFGSLDAVTAVPGGVRVQGWAADPNTKAPIGVHVYVDDRVAGTTAAGDRPDVARARPGWGAAHGYDLTVGASQGSHRVCAYAINAAGSGGVNRQLGCRTVTVG